jgi:hypothetical protein
MGRKGTEGSRFDKLKAPSPSRGKESKGPEGWDL